MDLFSDINHFLNSPQVVEVLYTLVLIMALLWLLTGGFSFLKKKSDHRNDDDGRK